MKSKKIISIASLSLLLLASLSYGDDDYMRNIKIPPVPEVTAVVPEAPKVTAIVPTPVQVNTIYPEVKQNRTNKPIMPNRSNSKIDFNREFKHKRNAQVSFSKRTPPNYTAMTLSENNILVGDIKNSRLSLYLRGTYMKPKEIEKKLLAAGYKILSITPLDKKKKLTSIVFTCSALEMMGDAPDRGFAASLRVLVDGINKQISIINPLYISRAFMQDDFEKAIPEASLKMLRKTFSDSNLTNSEDIVKFNLLPKYVFMNGMPGYKDMPVLGKGSHAELLHKAKKSKKVLFVQELSKNRAVVGIKLSKRTAKFIKKAGYANAALLPYPVLLENGEVKALDPKYYISVMYPLLKMGTFMKISTVPGAINNEIKKVFK